MFIRNNRYFQKKNLCINSNRKKVGIILFTMSIVLFFLFATRLTYIVLVGKVSGISLKEKIKALYEGSKEVTAKRGTIYDRNGEIIAEDILTYSLYVVIDKKYCMGDKKLYLEKNKFQKFASILSLCLEMDKDSILDRLNEGIENHLHQVEFSDQRSKNLTLRKKQELQAYMTKNKIKGLGFNEFLSRIYPNNVFSSHLIGYTAIKHQYGKNAGLGGQLGIESFYDKNLKGKNGKIVFKKDSFQNPLAGTLKESTPTIDGKNIHTTLDSNLQIYMEKQMKKYNAEMNPKEMTAILMKAKTGEILAMSQAPTFNPATKEGMDNSNFKWFNLITENCYEPGSTMKILTVAAAIENKVFDPLEIYIPKKINLFDIQIDDWDHGAAGPLTMRQALSHSSNIGMVKLEQRMKKEWQQYIKRFGFGKSTNSGLPEAKGRIPDKNPVDQAMSSFGQAISVTNLQMMQAFTSIANDGFMLKPYYIREISDDKNTTIKRGIPKVINHPITKSTARKVREYMRDTVEDENYGLGYGHYKVPGVHLSVKTGTAQVVASDGGYLSSSSSKFPYLYSAVVIAPTENPEYIFYFTINQPKSYSYNELGNFASDMLTKAFLLT